MLSSLEIRDILLIKNIKIDFNAGLNVFTGETGAGKSILLDCISFVLGFRGRSNYARRGADYGEVIATFELPPDHKIWQKFEDAGFEIFDYELVFKRKSFRDGKKVSFINEKRCSNQILREFSRFLVEIQDQNDDNGLRNETGPRTLLDIFGNVVKNFNENLAINYDFSLNSSLDKIEYSNDSINFTINKEKITCDHLIISDGVFSKGKSLISNNKSEPIYNNTIAIRGSISRESLDNINEENISLFLGSDFHYVLYPLNNDKNFNFIGILKNKLNSDQQKNHNLCNESTFIAVSYTHLTLPTKA